MRNPSAKVQRISEIYASLAEKVKKQRVCPPAFLNIVIISWPSRRSFPFDSRNTIERDIEYVRRKANERVAKQKLDNNYDLFS